MRRTSQGCVLQVLTAQEFEGSLQEQSQQARALWGSGAWSLADQCSKLSCEGLTPQLQQAQEWCRRYAQQLHSQKDTLQIKEALPDTNLQLFQGETLLPGLSCTLDQRRSCLAGDSEPANRGWPVAKARTV